MIGNVVLGNIGKGVTLYAKGSVVNIRQSQSTTAAVLKQVTDGKPLGTTSGYIYTRPGEYTWFQVQYEAGKWGWVRSDVVTQTPPAGSVSTSGTPTATSSTDGKTVLVNILKNDKYTYHNLLLCREMIERGAGSNAALITRYQALSNSYNARQKKIQSTQGVETVSGTVQLGWEWLKDRWSSVSGVGAIPLIPLVAFIGGAVVTAGTAYAIYSLLKPEEPKSFEDFKGSEELKTALYQSLPPNQADELLKMVQLTTHDAYGQGKSDGGGLLASTKNLMIIGAVGVGSYFLFFK